jgi:hypothetical protein
MEDAEQSQKVEAMLALDALVTLTISHEMIKTLLT